jgi:hypothetical protein
MWSEKEVKTWAATIAARSVISTTMAIVLRQQAYPEETVREILAGIVDQRRSETWPVGDAASSDLLASEVEEATRELLNEIFEKWKALRL